MKSASPLAKSLFENTTGNPFLDFLNTDRNAPKNLIQIGKYIALYQKTAFKTDFGPREVPQPENA